MFVYFRKFEKSNKNYETAICLVKFDYHLCSYNSHKQNLQLKILIYLSTPLFKYILKKKNSSYLVYLLNL